MQIHCRDNSRLIAETVQKKVTYKVTYEKGIKKGLFNGSDSWKLSWVLWSLFVGIGHLNEARQSLDAGKNNFESLFDFAYRGLMFKGNAETPEQSLLQ